MVEPEPGTLLRIDSTFEASLVILETFVITVSSAAVFSVLAIFGYCVVRDEQATTRRT
jgi:hypothetical protein